jgi:predicted dehydrogenase
MSATVADARRMLLAAQKSGTILMVNYPSTWNPALHKVKQLLDDGAIGQPVYFRWRAGHRGPLAGLPPDQQAKSWWHQRLLGGGALLEFIAADPLPPHFQNGVVHFLSALLEGTPLHETVSPEFNVGVQAILEAGMIAARTGTAVNPRLL